MSAKDNDWKFGLMVVGIVGAVLIATVLLWYFVGQQPRQWYSGSETEFEKAAQFGDSYGYVNALLSSLALGGALAAIFLQTIELRWQRKELQESQDVWREQTRQAEMQSRQQELQALVMADQVREISRQNQVSLLSLLYSNENEDAKLQQGNSVLHEVRWNRVKPLILEAQNILANVESRRKAELAGEIEGILGLCLRKINQSLQNDDPEVGVNDLRKSIFGLRRYGLRGRESITLSTIESVLDKIDSAQRPKENLEPLQCLGWFVNQIAESVVESEGIEISEESFIPEKLLGEYARRPEQLAMARKEKDVGGR